MSSPEDNGSSPIDPDTVESDTVPQLGEDIPEAEEVPGDENQEKENLAFARAFLTQTLRFKKVRIDREQFLKAELRKRGCSDARIAMAISSTPLQAGIALETLDDIAQSAVDFETKRSSAISFGTGLPGGLALLATVPGDMTQQYVFDFRIMQKVAYVYGWQSFLDDTKEVDDETLNMFLMFLSVMLGINGASYALRKFLYATVRESVEKQIARQALMKTVWYPILKRTLRYVGVQITRDSFAKAVAKGVPVVGGAVSGTMTFVTMKKQSARIIETLRELPPPGMDAEEHVRLVQEAKPLEDCSGEEKERLVDSVKKASQAIQGGSATVVEKTRGLRGKLSKKEEPTRED